MRAINDCNENQLFKVISSIKVGISSRFRRKGHDECNKERGSLASRPGARSSALYIYLQSSGPATTARSYINFITPAKLGFTGSFLYDNGRQDPGNKLNPSLFKVI
jgi:hypothetical protein